jgi:hypothetical protein
MVVALLVVLIILVVSVVVMLVVVAVAVVVRIVATGIVGIVGITSFWIVAKGHNIQHLNVHGSDGRSKRTLHCNDCFQCIGFGFLGGIDSDFWRVAVVT